ncbi:MAG: FAD-dependent oxidoreductase, partial [Pseudomonadota bacterium]|nr:FAD-dependent oxidoreductase [Pseudomonadota bacterium]
VIDPAHWPLVRLLPEAAGRALRAGLASAGVGWHLDTVVERIDRAGAAYAVTLASGARLEADLVLSAVGLRPRTALAKAAGLDAARGIKVDRFLQASREAVYALGDCAEVEGLVLPYVMPIMHAGRALARTLAGQLTAARYPPMPVVVKTPAHPVVVAPPHPRASGQWRCEPAGRGVRCLFHGPGGRLLGFALTGGAVAEKQALTRELPPLLA